MKDFAKQNLSYVTLEICETTRKGQSSRGVKVRDDGSFVAPSVWNVQSPGKYELSELSRASRHLISFHHKKNASTRFFVSFPSFPLSRCQRVPPSLHTLRHPLAVCSAALPSQPIALRALHLHRLTASEHQRQCPGWGGVPARPCKTWQRPSWTESCLFSGTFWQTRWKKPRGG